MSLEEALASVRIVPIETVASALRTTPAKVKSMMLNGTLPIGGVGSEGGRERSVVIESRLIAYLTAEDLKRG